jgi:periplasmic divalent cation tolerance protein
MSMTEFIQVFTTMDKEEDARRIGGLMVEKRLAACVQILGPITSIYRWKDKVEEAKEWLCILKTRQDLFRELEQGIKGVHPYEVPEIVALPIESASGDYLSWLREVTASRASGPEAIA